MVEYLNKLSETPLYVKPIPISHLSISSLLKNSETPLYAKPILISPYPHGCDWFPRL